MSHNLSEYHWDDWDDRPQVAEECPATHEAKAVEELEAGDTGCTICGERFYSHAREK